MQNLTIFSAGSFRYALAELAETFKQQHSVDIQLTLAPAGLLRQRIEAGEPCDIFISANKQNVEQLSATKPIYRQQIIAFNQLVLTTLNLECNQGRSTLDLLFDENLRLATSTPIADPCGDYTWALFDLLAKAYPTSGKLLKQRAMQLVGGNPNGVSIPTGEIASHYLLNNNYADMMIGYAHYQPLLSHSNLAFHTFPTEFQIRATYLAVQLNQNKISEQFLDFLHSNTAQAIILNHGFRL